MQASCLPAVGVRAWGVMAPAGECSLFRECQECQQTLSVVYCTKPHVQPAGNFPLVQFFYTKICKQTFPQEIAYVFTEDRAIYRK